MVPIKGTYYILLRDILYDIGPLREHLYDRGNILYDIGPRD